MKKELLAPAGDLEAGYAALYYGADAVYLGLKHFSARATAANFSAENLNEFVEYAHFLKRKVFVAVNTLLQENELDELIKTLDICAKYKVDALIIQDLGVAKVVREIYPELEMHASTQMAVHNKEGALALKKIGFSRVVLARELTLNEIKEIAAIPNLETEAFIHGALCYSYSGLCMFSSLETGKSANRGKCLYPCRTEFCGENGAKHCFSMKDMALQGDVLKMPVTSLKIEGRKKTALYVAAVTDYYRRILDGKGDDGQRAENIQQIFSRPWTKLHLNGKNKDVVDQYFVGHRGLKIGKVSAANKGYLSFKTNHKIARYDGIQIDVEGEEKPFGFSLQLMRVKGQNTFEAQEGEMVDIKLPSQSPKLQKGQEIYLSSSSEVKMAYPYSKPKAGEFKNRPEIKVEITVEAEEVKAQAAGFANKVYGVFEKANNPEKIAETMHNVFAKTGENNFKLGEVCIDNPKGLFVPVSLLNELRRGLYEKVVLSDQARALPDVGAVREVKEPKWVIKVDKVENLQKINLEDVAEIIFLLATDTNPEVLNSLPKNKLRLALPTVCRHPQLFVPLIKTLLAQGYKKWEIGNYWGREVLPENGIDLSFDYSLYVLNTQAVEMAKSMGANRVSLSPEDVLSNLKDVSEKSSLPVSFTLYQDVPLFISANCIRSNPCTSCPRGEKWMELERDGVKYKALSRDCQIMLFSEKALCFAAEAALIKADYYRVDFCYKKYNLKIIAEIWDKLRKFEDIAGCMKANINKPALL